MLKSKLEAVGLQSIGRVPLIFAMSLLFDLLGRISLIFYEPAIIAKLGLYSLILVPGLMKSDYRGKAEQPWMIPLLSLYIACCAFISVTYGNGQFSQSLHLLILLALILSLDRTSETRKASDLKQLVIIYLAFTLLDLVLFLSNSIWFFASIRRTHELGYSAGGSTLLSSLEILPRGRWGGVHFSPYSLTAVLGIIAIRFWRDINFFSKALLVTMMLVPSSLSVLLIIVPILIYKTTELMDFFKLNFNQILKINAPKVLAPLITIATVGFLGTMIKDARFAGPLSDIPIELITYGNSGKGWVGEGLVTTSADVVTEFRLFKLIYELGLAGVILVCLAIQSIKARSCAVFFVLIILLCSWHYIVVGFYSTVIAAYAITVPLKNKRRV